MATKFSPPGTRPFLKWAGGKFRLISTLSPYLPKTAESILIEPFVGAGAVFLNTPYSRFILNDANQDIINLFLLLQKNALEFINEAHKLFQPKYNQKNMYLALRQKFNQSTCVLERSVLFLYLNRHGYNGLCRYNQALQFNVPFGQYSAPYFPQKELTQFSEKAQKAQFSHLDCSLFFKKIIATLQKKALASDLIVYCDPPYVPLNKTARFTQYSGVIFNEAKQIELADFAKQAAQLGATVIISNHDTAFTQSLYQSAHILSFEVKRTISCNALNRVPVKELLAVFEAKKD